MEKGVPSKKTCNFIAGGERPRESERFEPQQAILWVKKIFGAKKCQMRKFFEKKNFFKFHQRSKKVEKMIAEPTRGVSEGGNRGKVVKKEK